MLRLLIYMNLDEDYQQILRIMFSRISWYFESLEVLENDVVLWRFPDLLDPKILKPDELTSITYFITPGNIWHTWHFVGATRISYYFRVKPFAELRLHIFGFSRCINIIGTSRKRQESTSSCSRRVSERWPVDGTRRPLLRRRLGHGKVREGYENCAQDGVLEVLSTCEYICNHLRLNDRTGP